MATVTTASSHAASATFFPNVPETETEHKLPLAGLNFERPGSSAESFSDSFLNHLYVPGQEQQQNQQNQQQQQQQQHNQHQEEQKNPSSSESLPQENNQAKSHKPVLNKNFYNLNKKKPSNTSNSNFSQPPPPLKPSPSLSSSKFRSSLTASSFLKSKPSFSSFTRSTSKSSIKRGTLTNSPTPSKTSDSSSNSSAPAIELPPVQVNGHYQDLTQLFDDPHSYNSPEMNDFDFGQDEESHQLYPSDARNPPAINTSFYSTNNLAPIKSEDALSTTLNLPEYAYYSQGSFHNADDDDDFPDDSSIQPSPVITHRPDNYPQGNVSSSSRETSFGDTVSSSTSSSIYSPQSLNKPSGGAGLYSTNGPTNMSASVNGHASVGAANAPSNNALETSPNLKQNTSSSSSPSSPQPARSPTIRYDPANNSANFSTPSPASTKQSSRNSLSTVAKVKSMFPGFASYKSLGKTSANSSPNSSPQLDDNNSSFQRLNSNGYFDYANGAAPNGGSSFVVLNRGNNEHDAEHGDLPFSSSKPTQHFHEIGLGPTYKAKITPVKHSNSFRNGQQGPNRSPNNSNNTSPVLTNKHSFSSLNASPPNNNQKYSSSERDQLLNQQNKAAGESLDFVPNLRPHIDSVGSRLRTVGVPSPANLMMTKSQYDDLKKKMDTKKELRRKKRDSVSEDEEAKEKAAITIKNIRATENDDEDDDDDDDDDDDEEEEEEEEDNESRRLKHLEEDEERKKQNIRMRLRQDAHLAVYRQKMTKLTGSQIGLSALGNINFPTSSTNLLGSSGGQGNYDSDDSDSDEYDDVPLGILKAHGFPASARLKMSRSQPNLLNQPSTSPGPGTPGMSHEMPGPPSTHLTGEKVLRPLGDSQSVRSFGSPVRANTPAPEEGFLAMRTPGNLPSVFGPNVPMNRGLIGEIAREEEAKLRRKSIMNNLARDRTSTLMDQLEGSSIYSVQPEGGVGVAAPGQGQGQSGGEIQVQLSQMMQILQQMQFQNQQQNHQPMPMNSPMTMSTFMPFAAPTPQFPQKNWSSFDVLGGPTANGGPMMRSSNGAASIRSYSPSINGSVKSGNEGFQGSQAKTTSTRPGPQHQHSYSTTSFKFPNGTTNTSYQPVQPPMQAQQYHAQQAAQAQQQLQQQTSDGYGTSNNNNNNTNSVRLVNPASEDNGGNDDEDDDEDEDEAGWQEMNNRRKALKDMWKASPSTAIAS